MLNELVRSAKVKGGVDYMGHVFSPDEADQILHSVQKLQKNQIEKLAAFRSLLNGAEKKDVPLLEQPPVITPPPSPQKTPPRPKRPRLKSPPPRPQKPKRPRSPGL
jgi:hypothetical protein